MHKVNWTSDKEDLFWKEVSGFDVSSSCLSTYNYPQVPFLSQMSVFKIIDDLYIFISQIIMRFSDSKYLSNIKL